MIGFGCLKIRRRRRGRQSNDQKSQKNVKLTNKIDGDGRHAAVKFGDGRDSTLHESAPQGNTNSTAGDNENLTSKVKNCCNEERKGESPHYSQRDLYEPPNMAALPQNADIDSSFLHPLHTAVWLRQADRASSLLEVTRVDELSAEEWFVLLAANVRNNMHDVALEILKKNTSLATMRNEEGTILHLLSQQDISDISFCKEVISKGLVTVLAYVPCLSRLKRIFEQPLMRKRALLLAEKLWAEIQKLEPANAHELMEKPPILNDAAKVGNVELITMLIRTYPEFVFDTDSSGYNMFHIAVLYRQEAVFRLIHQLGDFTKTNIAISTDKDGNNILHLAAKFSPLSRRTFQEATLQMERELVWFKEVEKIAPRWYLDIENKHGDRPRELFYKKHKWLLDDSKEWIKETTNSFLLIAIIMLLVMFATVFTVSIGNDGGTGIPIIFIRRSCFNRLVAVAMCCSICAVISFWPILTSGYPYQEDIDSMVSFPAELILGLTTLFASTVGTIISTYLVLFNEGWAWNSKSFAAFALVSLIVTLFGALRFKLWFDMIRSAYRSMFMF